MRQKPDHIYPIRCDNINITEVMEDFQYQVQNFPCKYLGLPLHYRQLRKGDIKPLIDKLSARLAIWKGTVYFLTIFHKKKGQSKELTRLEEDSYGRDQRLSMESIVWFSGQR